LIDFDLFLRGIFGAIMMKISYEFIINNSKPAVFFEMMVVSLLCIVLIALNNIE